ncbi:hypothetical protein BUALT_Bualt16G0106800 [Buddleja alternifolia]|uniref:Uncharacterized protein n=1 Tax=Buddleja alternifolia TaxID=168488 RepID=A0AAV6WL95_9LAMI|nr:hypothetical protein BUALT_Bualt16G0106800 [Buddleja alternifolia]
MKGEINEKLLEAAKDHNGNHKEEISLKNKIWSKMKTMWIVAGPAILVWFLMFGINVISQAFVGHIGSTELAAYALVFTVLLRFANSILAQSKNLIISYLAVFSLSIHVFLSWLLTVKYKFGIAGAMVSTILAYWIPNVGQIMYVIFGGCRETWSGLPNLAFKDLGPIVKLSLSSGAMICLELRYNSILILLTGNMKNAEVTISTISALSICLNISGWLVMISISFMSAASVRVSNELGRRDPKAAKFSIVMIVLTSFAIEFVLFMFFLFFRGRLAYAFTKNHDVVVAVARLSPLLAFSLLLNSVQPVLSGTMKNLYYS